MLSDKSLGAEGSISEVVIPPPNNLDTPHSLVDRNTTISSYFYSSYFYSLRRYIYEVHTDSYSPVKKDSHISLT